MVMMTMTVMMMVMISDDDNNNNYNSNNNNNNNNNSNNNTKIHELKQEKLFIMYTSETKKIMHLKKIVTSVSYTKMIIVK